MVPGMTERDYLAADQRRRAWLADALNAPAPRPRTPGRGRIGFGALRWTRSTLLRHRGRRRPTPAVGAPATPAPRIAPQAEPRRARP